MLMVLEQVFLALLPRVKLCRGTEVLVLHYTHTRQGVQTARHHTWGEKCFIRTRMKEKGLHLEELGLGWTSQ